MKHLTVKILGLSLLLGTLACHHNTMPMADKAILSMQPSVDPSDSDPKAMVIADAAMEAMGGKNAWESTRYISWNFFGARMLLWDKYTGNVRIEYLKKPLILVVNLNDSASKVWINGIAQTEPDTLKKYLRIGREAWINDSYWLLMPFKLRDPGVTLKYLESSTTEDGQAADLLQLTFKGVGVTPDNKYHVWVNKQSHLVTQWAYFEKFSDPKPAFTTPWADYKKYGNIMLSSSRGPRRVLIPIEVSDTVPADAFEK